MITWETYFQIIINGFFFGIGIMAAFAAGALVVAIIGLITLKVFSK